MHIQHIHWTWVQMNPSARTVSSPFSAGPPLDRSRVEAGAESIRTLWPSSQCRAPRYFVLPRSSYTMDYRVYHLHHLPLHTHLATVGITRTATILTTRRKGRFKFRALPPMGCCCWWSSVCRSRLGSLLRTARTAAVRWSVSPSYPRLKT